MSRARCLSRPLSEVRGDPFVSAEEAWLWFSQCQIARLEGVRFTADSGVARPCDPDDIYRAVAGLRRRRVLDDGHLRVLGRFGTRLERPLSEAGDTPWEVSMWDEALDRLSTVLRSKGIVE